MKNKLIVFAMILAITLLVGCSFQTNTVKEISINADIVKTYENLLAGSGSNLAITEMLVNGYEGKYNNHIEIAKSIGSSGAIKAVESGALQIGLISRPLKDTEIAKGLKEIHYARVGIVIGVNKTVVENNINNQELVDIILGKKSRWQNGSLIIVLMREMGDSSNQMLSEKIPGFKAALDNSQKENRWEVLYTDQEEANEIEAVPNSIGFTDTASIILTNPSIKPLKVNGVAPTIENLQNGSYELVKDLYFVVNNGTLPKWGRDFLEFVFSKEGSELMLSNGAIPVKSE